MSDSVIPACAVDVDAERRFGGSARLFGAAGLQRLQAGHVCVIGIGGVGSWAAEALARAGVGRLSLVDLDHVAESNVNRQVHALSSTLGAAKVEVMRRRIADIAPACTVTMIDDFVTLENSAALLPEDALLIDAIDQPRAKAALIALARRRKQPVVVCGGAGGRIDPLRLRRGDLATTQGDALLAAVRARLRREHGFPREAGRRFRVEAVWSEEPLRRERASDGAGAAGTVGATAAAGGAPLGCAGYGSMVTVTGSMGFAAAAWAIERLAREAG
ncbi:MAG: ThiF family adenylyltransferase [Burkholderiaceae bacterium]